MQFGIDLPSSRSCTLEDRAYRWILLQQQADNRCANRYVLVKRLCFRPNIPIGFADDGDHEDEEWDDEEDD